MLSDRTLSGKIATVGENGPADGLLISRKDGQMYVTSPQDNAVKVRDLTKKAASLTTLVQDAAALAGHVQRGAGRHDLRDDVAHPGFGRLQARRADQPADRAPASSRPQRSLDARNSR